MKKMIGGSILLILCFAVSGWAEAPAHWHGYVNYEGDPVEGESVYTEPTDGQTSTNADSFYDSCNANGMGNRKHYDYVHAKKTIGNRLKAEVYYANDYYYEVF